MTLLQPSAGLVSRGRSRRNSNQVGEKDQLCAAPFVECAVGLGFECEKFKGWQRRRVSPMLTRRFVKAWTSPATLNLAEDALHLMAVSAESIAAAWIAR